MAFSGNIKSRFLKPAVSAFSRIAGSGKDQALLLSKEAKSNPVALVWALGIAEADRDEKLSGMKAHLEAFGTVVVVCDSNAFSSVLQMGFLAEALPSRREQQIHMCDMPWQTYLTRRVSRIRRCWAPDFEFTLGVQPEDFAASCQSGKLLEISFEAVDDNPVYLQDDAP